MPSLLAGSRSSSLLRSFAASGVKQFRSLDKVLTAEHKEITDTAPASSPFPSGIIDNGGISFISNVTGFTQGLKHNQLRRIERLATRRVPAASIVSPELARQMSEISHETGRQIGVLINRT